MQIDKFCAFVGAFLALTATALGTTLTFIPQLDNGITNYSWFSSGNWFSTDAGGNLIPAGRLPLNTDTAIITGIADAGTSGLRVLTLIATNNAMLTNGTFAVENLVMLSGSSFNQSAVNVLVTMTVGGTNCALNGSVLTIFGTASGVLKPIAPAPAATLSLGQGAVIQDDGQLTLTDGSLVTSTDPPKSALVIGTGAILNSTNVASVIGSATNHLVIDNSGTIRADAGTLRFDGGFDWHSTGGAGEFEAATSNAFLLFTTPFHVDAGVTDIFTGSGTNRWIAGASVDGAGQVGGNLEILDSVSGTGGIKVLGTASPGGVLTWSNGAISLASIAVDSGASMIFSGAVGSTRQLSACTVNNSGACLVRTGDLTLVGGAVIFNLPSGTFELQADGTFSGASGPSGGAFNNAGTFLKTSTGITGFGTPVPAQGPDFNNTGLVDIQSGQLNLLGGISSGEFRTESGAGLWFWGGTHTLNSGAGFTGAGTVRLLQGIAPPTWLINGGITIANLEIGANGTIDAGGNTTNATYIGTLLADSNGRLNNGSFVAQNFQMLDQAALTNSTLSVSNNLTVSGTNCALLGSTLTLLSSGSGSLAPLFPATNCTLTLSQGSVFQDWGVVILGDGAVIGGGGLPPQSRLVVSPGASLVSSNIALLQGATTNHLIIDNSGTVRADDGILAFGTGLDWKSSAGSGEFKAAFPHAQLSFASPFHVDPGAKAVFSGPGTNLWLSGGTLAGEAQVSGNLQLEGLVSGLGTIHVLGSSTSGGVLNWANGTLNLSAITVDFNGKMLINAGPASGCQLSGCQVNNSGTCLWIGSGTVAAGAGASINNLSNGTLDLQTDIIFASNNPPLLALNNGGLMLKSGGKGSSTLAADFNNHGVVQIQSGSLTFEGAWTQTLGSTTVSAGAMLGGTILDVQGGTLEGLGTIDANVVSSGAVSPGSIVGILTLAPGMSYQQTASGTLALEIGGISPGSQYDQIIIGGSASLAGQLQLNIINGFTPKPGDQFQVLTCLSQTGRFSSLAASPISGMAWIPQYNGTNVTITLAEIVALGQPTVSKGVLNLPFNTTAGVSYVVQTSGSLAPPDWHTLNTLKGNGSIMNVSDSTTNTQRFYRILIQ